MSPRIVHAGTGYQYLLRSVATNDAHDRTIDTENEHIALSRYYQAKGTPPGRWIGSGLSGFESADITAGEHITASHMANLYGVGLHPEAEEIWRSGGTYNDAKLGRAFRTNTGNIPVLKALREAEKQFITKYQRTPTMEESGALAIDIGRQFYINDTGYQHPSGSDVIAWINEQKAKVTQGVAGFDWTFSPVKSVSVLWALADERTATTIADCHHKAVAEALSWAETNVARTRIGTNGIHQIETQGLIGAEFTHFDTRTGDPDLHSHVLISNKVQAPDGRWLTLDSQEIFRNAQAISARYDVALMEILSREMGLTFEPTSRGDSTTPVWEIAGMPTEAIALFSSRRQQAQPVFDQLVESYHQAHGRLPGDRARKNLWEQAILYTRDAKKPAESLNTLRQEWENQITETPGGDQLLAQIRNLTTTPAHDHRTQFGKHDHWDTDVIKVGDRVLAHVTEKRGVFGDHHIKTAVATELKGWKFTNADALNQAQEQITKYILDDKAISLSPGEILNLPGKLQDNNTLGVDRRVGRTRYTTQEILDAEAVVLAACDEPTAYTALDTLINETLAEHEATHGWGLNDGQEAMARSLLTSGALVSCGVGPAGTGKTTSMQIVTKVWQNQGHNVIGLAPSAQAAGVLGAEIGCDAITIDTFTHTWRGANPHKPGHDISALPITINPGDMLLVDEAGMASTQNLAALVEIAEASGAIIRMIGDPYQLSAVGSGGLFATACTTTNAVELTSVMRFAKGKDTEQADASLRIRKGDTTGLDLYENRGWVTGGGRSEMLHQAVTDYLADTKQGRTSLIIASTNADVDAMNHEVQAHRIAEGVVDGYHQVTVARGDQIGRGDTVISRKNQVFYHNTANGHRVVTGKTINGQLFTVVGIHESGDIEVKDTKTGSQMVIPSDYATQHLHLGYAATVHRAQGATVDVCRAVIDTRVDRAGLYVALSRGKHENRAYCVTETDFDFDAEDMHYHMVGENPELTPRDILNHAVATDRRTQSATDTAQKLLTQAMSPQRVAALYQYGCDIAIGELVTHIREHLIDNLPHKQSARLAREPNGIRIIESALRDLCDHGVDIRHLTLDYDTVVATNPETPLSSIIAQRIHDAAPREHTSSTDDIPAPPPPWVGDDAELRQWLQETYPTLVKSTLSQLEINIEDGSVLENEDLRSLNLAGKTIENVTFINCDLRGTNFQDATLRRVSFTGCTMDVVDFTDAKLSKVDFNRSVATNVTFENATLSADSNTSLVRFIDCVLEKAQFISATLKNIVFKSCQIIDADFRNITGRFGFFYDTMITRTHWPNYEKAGFRTLKSTGCSGDPNDPIVAESHKHEQTATKKTTTTTDTEEAQDTTWLMHTHNQQQQTSSDLEL